MFRYFLDAGQNADESFSSAQRVFRGVPTGGGAAFTKDTVYLRGLIGVHTFFRWALQHDQLRLCRWLFAGKMTLDDVQRFEPLFDSGRAGAAALAAALGQPRQRPGRDAGVLAVRQPHPPGPLTDPVSAIPEGHRPRQLHSEGVGAEAPPTTSPSHDQSCPHDFRAAAANGRFQALG